MEKIKEFVGRETYENENQKVTMYKILGCFIVRTKYSSMKTPDIKIYNNYIEANYYFIRNVMFILS